MAPCPKLGVTAFLKESLDKGSKMRRIVLVSSAELQMRVSPDNVTLQREGGFEIQSESYYKDYAAGTTGGHQYSPQQRAFLSLTAMETGVLSSEHLSKSSSG